MSTNTDSNSGGALALSREYVHIQNAVATLKTRLAQLRHDLRVLEVEEEATASASAASIASMKRETEDCFANALRLAETRNAPRVPVSQMHDAQALLELRRREYENVRREVDVLEGLALKYWQDNTLQLRAAARTARLEEMLDMAAMGSKEKTPPASLLSR